MLLFFQVKMSLFFRSIHNICQILVHGVEHDFYPGPAPGTPVPRYPPLPARHSGSSQSDRPFAWEQPASVPLLLLLSNTGHSRLLALCYQDPNVYTGRLAVLCRRRAR